MPYLLPEIHEEILIRLNVCDLIRCKSVCKYWKYLISHPRFIKSHIDRSHLSDQENDKIRHRRIVMSKEYEELNLVRGFRYPNYPDLCGSSNGLVCVLSPSRNEPLIINLSTREVRKLKSAQIPERGPWCSGFGYDSSTDDYKAVLGFQDGFNSTCFKVFSFRSNIWKVVGEVNYLFVRCMGVFCEGALHWVASDKDLKKNIILSFHLSEEKFMEVPAPEGVSYQWNCDAYPRILLGILEGCLCAYKYDSLSRGWVMKDYGKKEYWERFKCEDEIKYDVVHYLNQSHNYVQDRPLWNETTVHNVKLLLRGPLYVETLVSPYFPKTLNRKEAGNEHHQES